MSKIDSEYTTICRLCTFAGFIFEKFIEILDYVTRYAIKSVYAKKGHKSFKKEKIKLPKMF